MWHPAPGALRAALLLFGVNLLLCRDLFFVQYLKYMHTNEGAFLALARALREHPGEILWWPFWNAGMPFTHAYFPLLPAAAAIASAAARLDTATAYHFVCGLFYCLGPVALFLMAWQISRRLWPSFAAALGYSLFSPSTLLIPAIRDDLGSLWHVRRLQTLVFYSEGPHVTALALVPLAVFFLHRASRGGPWSVVPAIVFASGVVLTNAFGVASLALTILCLVLADTEAGCGRRACIVAGLAALALLWVSPWLPPSLVESIRINSQTAGGDFRPTAASIGAAILLPAIVLLLRFAVLPRLRLPFHLNFVFLFALLMSAVPLLAFHAGIDAVPQGKRYALELDMAVWLLAAFAVAYAARGWPRSAKSVCAGVLAAAAAVQFVQLRRYADGLIEPHPDITKTIEYRTAKWLEANLPGRRAMASGSVSLWVNAFADVPQLSGGNDATALNWMQRVAVYTIYSGDGAGERDGEICAMWLKAFGAHAITMHGAGSEEAYKPSNNPGKFQGLLPVLWREGDDAIYGVPQRSASLARVVPEAAVVARAPVHGLDVEPVAAYVAALDDPSLPEAEFRWRNRHAAVIRARPGPGRVIVVQTNYHPGWRATVGGEPREVFADGIGLLVVRPDCTGECSVELVFDGGTELRVARAISGVVTILMMIWLVRGRIWYKGKGGARSGAPPPTAAGA